VTEVGSASSAFGWFSSCLSMFLVVGRPERLAAGFGSGGAGFGARSSKLRLVAAFGALAALSLVLMKFLPMFPGHFSIAEYVALGIWVLVGLLLRRW
jgi:hypothetical protein